MSRVRGLSKLPVDACCDTMDSPVGVLTLVASSKGLHAILWDNDRLIPAHRELLGSLSQSKEQAVIRKTKTQLQEYFLGARIEFDLPLILDGTPFQLSAWDQLLEIPYGSTISYGEQAERLGDKKKARAVGTANAKNPLSIIVPCHRVIGADHQLRGFAGGLDKKSHLLQLEAAQNRVYIFIR